MGDCVTFLECMNLAYRRLLTEWHLQETLSAEECPLPQCAPIRWLQIRINTDIHSVGQGQLADFRIQIQNRSKPVCEE